MTATLSIVEQAYPWDVKSDCLGIGHLRVRVPVVKPFNDSDLVMGSRHGPPKKNTARSKRSVSVYRFINVGPMKATCSTSYLRGQHALSAFQSTEAFNVASK